MPRTKKTDEFSSPTTIQMPSGMKFAVDELLDYLGAATGEKITRSEFISSAVKYFMCYCLEARSEKEIRLKLDEFVKRAPIDIPREVKG